MRGSRAKSLMRYVDDNFPMLSEETVYGRKPDGTLFVHPSCRRGVYRNIKKNWKRRHLNG